MYLDYRRRKPRRWPYILGILVLALAAGAVYVVQSRPELIPVNQIRELPLPAPIATQVAMRMATVVPPTPTPVPTPKIDYLMRGDAFFHEGQLTEALRAYETAAQLDPDNAAVYARWSRILTLRRSFNKAIEKANRAIELAPNRADGYATLTVALDWSGQYDKALAAGRKATQLNPNSSDA